MKDKMTDKNKADARHVRYTNPFDNLPDNQTPNAFDYSPNSADLQCFNCAENLQNKEFAVGVCRISAALGINALLPFCLECCEFLETGDQDLVTEAFARLRRKTLSRAQGGKR